MDSTAAPTGAQSASTDPDPGFGDLGLRELGIDAPAADAAEPVAGRTRLAAWGLAIAGTAAFATLVVGAIAVVNWALPYVHYAYLAILGGGVQEF